MQSFSKKGSLKVKKRLNMRDNYSTNNASNQFDDVFPSENITVNNTPFPLSSNTIYVPDDYAGFNGQWIMHLQEVLKSDRTY